MRMPAGVRAILAESGPAPMVLLVLAILAMLAIHAVATVSAYDDAFITFRYVHNVVEGRGPVYNEGERVFGISTPLYGAWLTVLQLVLPGVDLPVLAARGNGFFLAAAGLLAYILLVRIGTPRWTAALGGAAVVLSDGILRPSIGGMESSMFVVLAIGAALACLSRRDGLALLLASLTALVRPEGILLAGLVVLARLADPESRSIPPRLWLATSPLIIWVVAATLYYGSPIPHSIVAKSRPLYPLPAGAAPQNLLRHMGEWTLDGVEVAVRAAAQATGLAVAQAHLVSVPVLLSIGAIVTTCALAGWPHAGGLRAGRSFVLPGFLLCVLILYAITNPYLLPWYFPIAHAPWLILVLAACASLRTDRLRLPVRLRVAAGCLVAVLVCLAAFGPTFAHLGPSDWSLLSRGALTAKQAEVLAAYQRTSAWVGSHSDASETVAAPEIGMLGYHLDRKLLDACGLVTKEAIPFLPVPIEQRGSQQGVISVDFVQATSPDLVVTLPTFARTSLLRSDWFLSSYGLVHEERVLHGAGQEQGVLVFRRMSQSPGTPVDGR